VLRALLAAAALALLVPAAAPAKTVWLCRPGLSVNPCAASRTATAVAADGARRVERFPATKPLPIDCFYVYPTVSRQTTVNASLTAPDPGVPIVATLQASRFASTCRVYAPKYRQVTVSGLAQPIAVSKPAVALAYSDVRAAWRDYLAHDNHGRGVVLIGHSQGTFVLRELIAKEIDPKPKVRKRLVSAVLLGGNVTVKKGKDVGGDFKHVRACRAPKQLGCVVAFSTFEDQAPADSIFGRTSAAGLEVLCTNPAALGGGSVKLDSIYPSAPFAPGTIIATAIKILGITQPTPPTTWAELPGSYSGRCSSAGGADVLQITPRKGAPKFTASPDPTWGLHLVDANIALGNLVDLVHTQGTAYLKKHGG
jgi:hypothetical protein